MSNRELSSLAEVVYGRSPNAVRSSHAGYPMYGTGGVVGYSSVPLFDREAVIVPRKGSLGNPQFAAAGFWAIDTTFVALPKEDVDAKWLYYQLAAFDLTKLNEATGVPSINRDWLLEQQFQTPSFTQQRRIAAILSALDEQIGKTEALVEKLLLQRTGVVQQSLLPLARESETFELGTLASLVTSGSRGWGKYYSEYGALFLRIGNLTREHPNLRLNDIVRVKVPAGGEGERTRVQGGDLLISITADLGVIGCIPAGFEEAYVNQHIALVRIESEKVHPRWVAHVLGSLYGAEQFLALNATGAKAGLNLPSVRCLRVPCPSLTKQQRIVDTLDSIDSVVEAEKSLLNKLRLQKAGLMRDMLTGTVRVSE